ncbi:MAG TPA: ADP-ribosylglycohydrolase family protein [Solirubrobacterales bacterium]|nr:ADP-ribosylglycohydrolase family protein [Solirubrobacterales bacterium]
MVRPEPETPAGLTSRAQAAMLWAACGDALGWPMEPRGQRVGGTTDLEPNLSFLEWTRREGGRFSPFQRRVPAGAYSDDTQLALCVARSLTRGDDWWQHLTAVELPAWTLYEMGGGGAIKRAARGWAKGTAPWEVTKSADRRKYFSAGANGVAMRVLPHAIFGAGDTAFDQVCERIVADGIATHGHPRALVGALAAGYAMWTALRWQGKVNYGELIEDCLAERQAWVRLPESALAPGWIDAAGEGSDSTFEAAWARTCEEMVDHLTLCSRAIGKGSLARDEEILDELGAFGKEGGSGTRTAAAAIYLASRYVAKPAAGLLAAAFARRADTDTLACLSGAMLGAFCGEGRVNGLASDLQDVGYIRDLAAQVAQHNVLSEASDPWAPRARTHILDALEELEPGATVSLPLFGEGRVEASEGPETRSANEVRIWWLSTQLGQTIAVTRIRKLKPAATAGPEPAAAQSTWTFLFVRQLPRSLELYRDILGVTVRRLEKHSAVLAGNIVLEESDREEPPRSEGLTAPEVIGVFVTEETLDTLHGRVADAGYDVSEVTQGRHGKRFRLRDADGHVVEVCTSPPSR